MELLLVRHGQSEWNAQGRWQGQADPPLTDLGREQARAAAQSLGTVDAVAASTLDRAHTTAMLIAESLGVGPILIDPDFMERNAGEWQGLTREEIDHRYPDYLTDGRRPEGYEKDESVLRRALAAMRRIEEHVGDGLVVVITHGGVIYAVEDHLDQPHQRIANLGGRWITYRGGDLTLGDRIELVAGASQPGVL